MDYETYDEGPEDFEDHCDSKNCTGNEIVNPSEKLKVRIKLWNITIIS